MKVTKRQFLGATQTVALLLALSFQTAAQMSAQMSEDPQPKQPPGRSQQIKVMLSCERVGAPSDVVRTMRLTNNTGATIGKGRRIYWSTSDGEKGSMLLPNHFAKGGSLQVYDNIGDRQYTCEAWLFRAAANPTPER